ncbi:MAG: flippase-like domain-containing protein [Planctomycetes bacterium]|nr:flippase-like domain-containing protein [Planctomycetota bacterium]
MNVDPASKTDEPERGRAGSARKPLLLALKLLLGVGIIALIAWKLPIRDGVYCDEVLIPGRGLSITPDGGLLAVTTKEDERLSVPRNSGVRLITGGKGLLLRRLGLPDVALKAASFHGEVRLDGDNGLISMPLNKVDCEERALSGSDEKQVEPRVVQGLETIMSRIEARWLCLAAFLVFASLLLGALRWELLVRAQGLALGFQEAVRLTFIGLFFNNVVPGSTGGDIIKAWMLARRYGGRRAAAVTTVLVDRVLGLFVLAGCAAVVMLFDLANYRQLAVILWTMLGCVAFGTVVFLSRRVRRALRVDRLLKRLPAAGTLMELDQAIVNYRQFPGHIVFAAVLSLVAQVCFVGAVVIIGFDLGMDATSGLREPELLTYIMTLPCIFIVSAVPVLPGGWGVGEAAYAYFFSIVGVLDLAIPVALSVITRALLLTFSLFGGLMMLRSRRSGEAKAAEHSPR